MAADVAIENKPTARHLPIKSVTVVAVCMSTALGDWLFWGYVPGISLLIFLACLAFIQMATSRGRSDPHQLRLGCAALAIGLLPMIETVNFLTVLSGICGTFFACMMFRGSAPAAWPERLDAFIMATLLAGLRFPIFVFCLSRQLGTRTAFGKISGWFFPGLFAAFFIALFVDANPIWQRWFEHIDLPAIFNILLSDRLVLWLALAWLAYPFIEPATPLHRGLTALWKWPSFFAAAESKNKEGVAGTVFFERCLILFNLVFAAQTALDLTYLWGGATLPEGMTYASYAQRGAYPLVAATLLAGAFIIAVMRPGGPGEQSQLLKRLVLIWVAQNLMLLLSSVLRLALYVGAYGLTYWRLATFIWMTLVAVGLVLIIARFILGRSSAWLIAANTFALLTVLYGSSLVNFPYVVSMWNVTHSNLLVKGGAPLDLAYLSQLGPFALPAVRLLQAQAKESPNSEPSTLDRIEEGMLGEVPGVVGRDWRSWTFRGERLDWFVEAGKFASASTVAGTRERN